MSKTTKPEKRLVSLEQARMWSPADYLIQVKCDGEFKACHLDGPMAGWLFAGEWVTPRSGQMLTAHHEAWLQQHPAGIFIAFDVLATAEWDCRNEPTKERWIRLRGAQEFFPINWFLLEVYNGPDFIDRVLAGGGEGVVAKGWQDPYGAMLAVKRLKEYTVVVTQIDHRLSVGIAERVGGVLLDRGRVNLGMNVDKVRLDSKIRVVAMDVFDSGKLREPRVAQGEWLVEL
jgi:hypothetical protein